MEETRKYILEASRGTRAVHAGQEPDAATNSVNVPINLSTTYTQPTPGDFKYEYSRTGNPTREHFEAAVAAMEKCKYGVAFSSGSAACMSLIHTLKAGDHVVAMGEGYGGTIRYFNRIATNFGVTFSYADFTVDGELEAAVTDKTKMIWMESPTNPTLRVIDARAVAAVAKKHNLQLVFDNTFATPFFQTPIELGATAVLHSVTKYINGHSDVVMGIVTTNDADLNTALRFTQNGLGAVPSPFDCYLAMRGLKTLHVRLERAASNALAISQFLEAHPKVEKVLYPGLESHPQHALAKSQMHGFGGMVAVYLKGDIVQMRQFLENVHLFKCAESLGAVESLINHPNIMTHASVPEETKAKFGINDSLMRISVGIEDIADLLKDLTAALEKVTL